MAFPLMEVRAPVTVKSAMGLPSLIGLWGKTADDANDDIDTLSSWAGDVTPLMNSVELGSNFSGI